MKLEFMINQQKIISANTKLVANNSRNYLLCKFSFDSDWDTMTDKYAIFESPVGNKAIIIEENNEALVPYELIGNDSIAWFSIGVFGTSPEKDISTGKAKISVSSGVQLSYDEIGTPEEQQSLYQQAVDLMEVLEENEEYIMATLADHEERLDSFESSGGTEGARETSQLEVTDPLVESISGAVIKQKEANTEFTTSIKDHETRISTLELEDNGARYSSDLILFDSDFESMSGLATKQNVANAEFKASINDKSDIAHTHNEYSPIIHAHEIDDVNNLQTELDSKSDTTHIHIEYADKVHGHVISDVSNLQNELDNKADDLHTHAEYSPVVHTHTSSQITDLQPKLDEKSDVIHVHEIDDVNGLQLELDSKAEDIHVHAISDVTGLQVELDNKAEELHIHEIVDVNGLQLELDGKAEDIHNHVISDVTGLQVELDNKAQEIHSHTEYAFTIHGHAISDVANLQTELDNKSDDTHIHGEYAAIVHGHAISDVANLQTELDGKADIIHNHELVTTSTDGFMSSTDKVKLDGLTGGGEGESMTDQEILDAIKRVDGVGSGLDSDLLDGFDSTYFATDIDLTNVETIVADHETRIDTLELIDHEPIDAYTKAESDTLFGEPIATHEIEITTLQTEMPGKANIVHTHSITDVDNLQTELDSKADIIHAHTEYAPTVHGHSISDVSNLQVTLDGKADDIHIHSISDTTNLQTELDNKAGVVHSHTEYAPTSHMHSATDITQDSTHRFATDSEKTTWNNKASTAIATTTANGLMSAADKSKLDGISDSGSMTDQEILDAVKRVDGSLSGIDADLLDGNDSSYFATDVELTSHTSDTLNPHAVTKSQVGLNDVDNTSDINKPISTATQIALDGKSSTTHSHVEYAPTVHTHVATDVTQDSTHRFVTDTEKTTWNDKANTVHAHVISDVTDLQVTLDEKMPTTGGTFTGDVAFGAGLAIPNMTAANPGDFSKHIQLYSPGFGFTVTSGNLNYVSGVACSHTFYTENGGVLVGKINAEINEPKDLITKEYADANYSGGSMTDQEVIDAVKRVDGTGSGLDADLLDGNDSSYFATNADLATLETTVAGHETEINALQTDVAAMPTFLTMTQAEYDALPTKDPNTFYSIIG